MVVEMDVQSVEKLEEDEVNEEEVKVKEAVQQPKPVVEEPKIELP